VGSDPAASGVYQAEIMIDYLQNHPEADKNKNGQIEYVMIKGEPSHQDTQLRTSAFIRTMMDAGFAGEPLYSGNANWSYARAITEIQNALSTYRIDEIEAIICNNDAMALGVLNELQARGYNKGDSSKFIPLIGIDALPKAVEAVSRGQMIGTVYNDSQSMAEILVKMGKALAEGRAITEEVVELPVVDRQINIPYVKYSMQGN
ncbi:MAG: substrate-binding domain-containing protein, partial [Proteobacteria bacterium]|nr:substrate-binding domain-containing protein [Candidatus Avisuccinivibrio stercorigallinarum]